MSPMGNEKNKVMEKKNGAAHSDLLPITAL